MNLNFPYSTYDAELLKLTTDALDAPDARLGEILGRPEVSGMPSLGPLSRLERDFVVAPMPPGADDEARPGHPPIRWCRRYESIRRCDGRATASERPLVVGPDGQRGDVVSQRSTGRRSSASN